MTDTITESFCERCGAKYSFDALAKPRRSGLVRVRVVSRGLKNFVANDGMPMGEAMAAARDEEERAGTARQLDAFHSTFNFCMGCRQYTCPNCWNTKAGECLTCSPDLSREVLPAAFPNLPLDGPAGNGNGLVEHDAGEMTAWPQVDLERAEADGDAAPALFEAGAEPEAPEILARLDTFAAAPPAAAPPAAAASAAAASLEAATPPPAADLTDDELAEIQNALAATPGLPGAGVAGSGGPAEGRPVAPAASGGAEPIQAAAPDVAIASGEPTVGSMAQPAAEPIADLPVAADGELGAAPPADAADTGRAQTRHLLGRFRPVRGEAPQFGAAEPAQPGASQPAIPKPETPAPAGPTPDVGPAPAGALPDVAAAPAAAAAAAAASEVVPRPTEPEPAASPEPEPAASPPAAAPQESPIDTVAQPTWQTVAPDTPAAPPPSWPDAPAWPAASARGAAPPPVAPATPWASRLAMSRPEPSGVWAASSQELLAAPPQAAGAAPAVQACVSCGLSLSANARFCRRCGTRQG